MKLQSLTEQEPRVDWKNVSFYDKQNIRHYFYCIAIKVFPEI